MKKIGALFLLDMIAAVFITLLGIIIWPIDALRGFYLCKHDSHAWNIDESGNPPSCMRDFCHKGYKEV